MTEPIPLSSPRGRGVLMATVLGSGVAFLDTTVVNVALPTLERELHTGMSGLQWTVDGYLLTLGALLLVGGALGDRYGRRRVYAIGLVAFVTASLACGLAPSVEVLIAARLVQGVGGALLVPGSLSLLRAVLREEDVGRAIGLWSGLSGVTIALGPLVGGWLIGVLSWRAAFFINVPLGAAAIGALLRHAPESRDPHAPARPDVGGALLATVGLGGAVYALIEGPARGWTPTGIGAGLVGIAALVAFVIVESRTAHPMLPLEIFRSLPFTGANGTTLGVYFALGGSMFFGILELQRVVGYSPVQAGAAFLPMTALMLVFSPLAGKWASVTGHRSWMTAGPIAAAVGLALFSRVGPGASYARDVLPAVGVLGLGLSATVAPLTDAVLKGAPRRLAGLAAGVNNAVARIAGLLAVALLPWATGVAHSGEVSPGVFDAAFARAMWICAGAALAGAAVAFATMDRRPSAEG